MELSEVLSLKVLLASKSPRRLLLLEQMGFKVERVDVEVNETLDSGLSDFEMTLSLADKKNRAFGGVIPEKSVLIAADTLVFSQGVPLGKPKNFDEARDYLHQLSNHTHKVITACAIRTNRAFEHFYETALVRFAKLSDEQIDYYIRNFRPYDKAGAYGIQEWIGLTGIEAIEGDYYTIMGLACRCLFATLSRMQL